MKYKDLNIGDWFSCEGETFIKTYCLPLKEGFDFCISPNYFGMRFAPCKDDTEIQFVSRLNIVNPYYQKETTETALINAMPLQFLSWVYDGEEVIFIKAFIHGKIYDLTINGDYNTGLWAKSSACIPVKIIPRIDLKYEEKT